MRKPKKSLELPYELLSDLYQNKEYSTHKIASILGLSAQKILNELKRHNIPRRPIGSTTLEQRKLISESRLGDKNVWYGKKRPEHSKAMMGKFLGCKPSEETRQKMSAAQTGRYGPLSNKWVEPNKRKGKLLTNIRRTEEMKVWRFAVLERDGFRCIECLTKYTKKTKVQVDHIKPLSILVIENQITTVEDAIACEALWNVENGRALCVPCHKKTDTYGGKMFRILKNYG